METVLRGRATVEDDGLESIRTFHGLEVNPNYWPGLLPINAGGSHRHGRNRILFCNRRTLKKTEYRKAGWYTPGILNFVVRNFDGRRGSGLPSDNSNALCRVRGGGCPPTV